MNNKILQETIDKFEEMRSETTIDDVYSYLASECVNPFNELLPDDVMSITAFCLSGNATLDDMVFICLISDELFFECSGLRWNTTFPSHERHELLMPIFDEFNRLCGGKAIFNLYMSPKEIISAMIAHWESVMSSPSIGLIITIIVKGATIDSIESPHLNEKLFFYLFCKSEQIEIKLPSKLTEEDRKLIENRVDEIRETHKNKQAVFKAIYGKIETEPVSNICKKCIDIIFGSQQPEDLDLLTIILNLVTSWKYRSPWVKNPYFQVNDLDRLNDLIKQQENAEDEDLFSDMMSPVQIVQTLINHWNVLYKSNSSLVLLSTLLEGCYFWNEDDADIKRALATYVYTKSGYAYDGKFDPSSVVELK